MKTLQDYILGAQARFARAGASFTSPSAGTVSATAFPDEDETAAWIDLGVVEDGEIVSESTDVEQWAPSPGRLQLKNIHQVKGKLTFKLTTNEMGPLAAQALFQTAAELSDSITQFNPLSGATLRGVMQLEAYDHDNTLRLVLRCWGRLKVTGGVKATGGDLVKPQFEFLVLYSTENVGSIS